MYLLVKVFTICPFKVVSGTQLIGGIENEKFVSACVFIVVF